MERFYYYDDANKIVYHTTELVEDRPDLIFLGSSLNPNPKKAAAGFTHKMKQKMGHKVRELS